MRKQNFQKLSLEIEYIFKDGRVKLKNSIAKLNIMLDNELSEKKYQEN